ncbi:MAG: hypothetical protein M1820_007100 [Bogoriella megaspora]|nr:MAG: hypothetical protein M1820_007100 [Bogoriella megaspora]
MATQGPDPNMFTTPFQLTKAMHRDVYDAVNPNNPALKDAAAGKVVVITGAAGGLGFSVAKAWSDANAAGVVLVGRNEAKLKETADALKAPTLVAAANITSSDDMKVVYDKTVAKFGRVDVVINTAGSFNVGAMTSETEPSAWWTDVESNVLGFYNVAHYFIKATSGEGTIVNLTSLAGSFSVPGISAYSTGKLAAMKLAEYLSLENPRLRVFSFHPGMVEAEQGRGMVVDAFTLFAKDKQALTAGVTLYVQKSEADFLRGGFFSVNWDVDEMEKNQDEIKEKGILQLGFIKAQLSPDGHPWSG